MKPEGKLRIAILGRTHWLLNAAKAISTRGHNIVFVATASPAKEYLANEQDFQQAAQRWGASFYSDIDINSEECIRAIESCKPDLAISVNWPTLILAATISACGRGILNGHLGDLPRYRGNACPNWAILNGENRIGLAIHFMNHESIDSGPVVYRRYMDLDDNVYIEDVYNWLDTVNAESWCAALENLVNPDFQPEEQEASDIRPLRCHPRRPSDGLIDWKLGAAEICRLVRASSRPFEGAFSYIEGRERITIWRASPVTLDYDVMAVPGQLMKDHNGSAIVICGDGFVRLDEVETTGDVKLLRSNKTRLLSPIEH